MTEPNVSFAAASAAASMFIVQLGLSPTAVQWAAIGAGGGMLLAASIGRWKALAAFPFVVFMSAGIGEWAAAIFFGASVPWKHGLSAVLAFTFHPLVAAAMPLLPDILKRLSRSKR